MLHLAVDDRGDRVLLVLLHRGPHLGDPGAGGIHDVAAPFVEQLHLLNGGAEGGKDHHITGGDAGKILDALFNRDELNIHLAQMVVHRRVVDDLIGDPQALGGVVLAGLVGHGHGPLHPPAEPEGLGQANREPAMAELVAVVPDRADQAALVGLFKAFSHFLGPSEAPPVVAL